MQAQGIVAIQGGYVSGKTSLIPLIAHGLLAAEDAIKDEKKRQLQSDVARTYTIAEMLASDAVDSDEEMYDNTASSKQQATQITKLQYPWYQPTYETVFDQNEGLLDSSNL
mmetsp:Transcript_16435/g.22234  ORF Transcript_16435/g.22234 Transcript_16435/m.22234 type:complete len:111 (+) Transcript_16435:783-1115(+)